MLKNKALRFGFFVAMLLVVAATVLGLSFHAHAAAPASVTTSTPHVSILRHKGGAAFGQTSITVTHGVPFNFDNRTIAAQSVLSGKKTLLTINPKSSAPYTFTRKGTFTLSLASNSAATLTVTVQ